MIYVSGSECIGRCGQLPLKGSASSNLHQFVRIVTIKSLNSNCVLVLLFQHHQHHHHIFHDQHNDRQHHHDQHQVPANMTSISGLTPSRPMALSTSFLLGFSDACFITQVESSSLSASLFFFLFILVQV